ncbi:MAG: hypothetical protein KVP17_002154 [Porospora cf. gigantea B]|uniref:uncharacterized protein n=1 Tax=Porospora cf. gigantea B TaxID=2853592 RepID=UPI003571802A|nr:MAG: hypothetical protein KVP17_002154 [Porospora cf. gigantea B]
MRVLLVGSLYVALSQRDDVNVEAEESLELLETLRYQFEMNAYVRGAIDPPGWREMDNNDNYIPESTDETIGGSVERSTLHHLCPKEPIQRKLMLVLLFTRLDDSESRDWIRKYMQSFRSDFDVLFPVGTPDSDHAFDRLPEEEPQWDWILWRNDNQHNRLRRLYLENKRHHDILLSSDYKDEYCNLGEKMEVSMREASRACHRQYLFIAKSDIDAPVNYHFMPRLIRHIMRSGVAEDNVFGAIWRQAPIIRGTSHKNAEETHLPMDHYHSYPSGVLYFASPSTWIKMTFHSNPYGKIRNDDVLVGMLAHQAGAGMQHVLEIDVADLHEDHPVLETGLRCDKHLVFHNYRDPTFEGSKRYYELYDYLCKAENRDKTFSKADPVVSRTIMTGEEFMKRMYHAEMDRQTKIQRSAMPTAEPSRVPSNREQHAMRISPRRRREKDIKALER